MRLSDSFLILGNGGVKKTRTYDEVDELPDFVVLQLVKILRYEKAKDFALGTFPLKSVQPVST